MPTNLNTGYLGRLSQSQLDTVTYMAGVDSTGAISTASFNTYLAPTNPPNVTVTGTGLGQAGTVYYSFDTTSTSSFQFDAATKDNAAQALQLWSGLTNINFVYAADLTTAPAGATRLLFVHANDTSKYGGTTTTNGSGTLENTQTTVPTGTTGITQATVAQIQVDTSGGFGAFGSTAYTTANGYGIDVLVHEVGHLVGLGHTGPYNGTVNEATQQNNSTDVRTWSIMSYIDPTVNTAKYFSSYSPSGVSWLDSNNNSYAPFTPMGLDIFAAQRLTGAPTSTMFAGGQTFGFNSNIMYTAIDGTQKKLSMYDFTIDTTPVVTIYDTGTGNTLDLSGFKTVSNINLNDGTFSSAAGLTNNIFIEYGTKVNSAVGGDGNDTITVNADADIINGGGGTNTVVFSAALAAYTIGSSNGAITVTNTANSVTDTLTNVQFLKFTDQTVPACFAAGTLIRTNRGSIAVEDLREADLVETQDGAFEPIVWIAHSRIDCTSHDQPTKVWPIRIAAGALGQHLPARPLFLSPEHAIYSDGALIPAACLVNGLGITQEIREEILYFHIALARHTIILAENLPCETLLDVEDFGRFDNEHTMPAQLSHLTPCAPRLRQGARVEAIRSRVDRQLKASGSFL